MNWCKLIKYGILIFTFIDLTMCPAAEKIGKGYVDHTVIAKIRSVLDKEQSPDYRCSSPCFFPHAAASTLDCLARLYQPVTRFLSPGPATMLSLLSTTRLLL
jgi:hypothetical protein